LVEVLVKRIATMALLFATLASGQWLGEKLSLLDTLRIPAGYQSLAYNRWNHQVYLGGNESDSILVIDADRCRATEWITVGRGVQAMCYNLAENKLYCACDNADTVAVLDGTSHQLLARIGVDSGPCVLCLDASRNKLYVGNRPGASVSVIDCRADTVVRTIDCRRSGTSGPSMMCLAASASRLFCGDRGDSFILAIDCSADTVDAVIKAGRWPRAMCFSPVSNRLYCACWGDSESMVYGVDVGTDSVVWSFDVRGPVPLCCDPAGERMFVPDFDTLFVVDCSADTVIAKVNVREDDVKSFVGYSAVDDRVYVVGMGSG
jgi:DNA-binding beta-propeller fold protein YncE